MACIWYERAHRSRNSSRLNARKKRRVGWLLNKKSAVHIAVSSLYLVCYLAGVPIVSATVHACRPWYLFKLTT